MSAQLGRGQLERTGDTEGTGTVVVSKRETE